MQLKNGQVVLVVLTNRGVNVDKKSLGEILINMNEQDEVKFLNKKEHKEYKVLATQYKYDRIKEKQIVTFLIAEE